MSDKTYIKELEEIIRDELLPIYEKYFTDDGKTPFYSKRLLALKHSIQRSKREVPALLKVKAGC